ncbi:MAG: hypothetical protein ACLSVD_08985 [Eggerthellaceae bacterium]
MDVRDAINAGSIRVRGWSSAWGHGARRPRRGLFAHVASTSEEARAIVRDCFSHK